jgi:hypothetical protein
LKYRLLVEWRVLKFLETLKRRDREFLLDRFESMLRAPGRYAEFQERDESGRMLDGHIAGRFAILFWDDFADRHLKIMSLGWSDK